MTRKLFLLSLITLSLVMIWNYCDVVFVSSFPDDFTIASRDCQCKSMFTIGGCDMEKLASSENIPKAWGPILRSLSRAENGEPVSITSQLRRLARYLPTVLNLENLTGYSQLESEKYPFSTSKLNGSQVEDNQYITKMPYIPCKIYIYSNSEIKQCLKLRRHLTGKILRIAFVGDSQPRNLLEEMVLKLRVELDLSNGNETGANLGIEFLKNYYTNDLPITGDDIEMRLYWSASLDLLKSWAKNKATDIGEEVPDILYFDDGVWKDLYHSEIDSTDRIKLEFDEVKSLLKNISRTSLILFRPITPVKEWIATKEIRNSQHDIVNQLAWLKFTRSGVWTWDTITPLYIKEINECRNHWSTHVFELNLPKLWNCLDFQHPSEISESFASNMLWNYVCNNVMNHGDEYCCGK